VSLALAAFIFADTRPYTAPKGVQAVMGVLLLGLAGAALLATAAGVIRVRRLRYLYAHRPEIIAERLARGKAKQRAIQERRAGHPSPD
jgi:hypothetical protein